MLPLIIVISIVVIYLFLIFPAIRKHPDAKICQNLYVAHRGLHDAEKGIPENSLKSFKNAMDKGYAIEIDLHLTKDGKVVIFHDDTLSRICGNNGEIEKMTLNELSYCRLSGTDEKIPELYELLEICDQNTLLVIEFKCTVKNYKELCLAANKVLDKYNVKYIIQSFNPLAVGWYRKNRKDICRGQLSSNFLKDKSKKMLEILCGFLVFNFISRPDFISYNIKHPNTLSRRICLMLGAMPAGWTIRKREELEQIKGKYNIYIFEDFEP